MKDFFHSLCQRVVGVSFVFVVKPNDCNWLMAFHFEAKSVAQRAEVAMVQLRSSLGLQPVDSEYNPVLLNTHHTPKKTSQKNNNNNAGFTCPSRFFLHNRLFHCTLIEMKRAASAHSPFNKECCGFSCVAMDILLENKEGKRIVTGGSSSNISGNKYKKIKNPNKTKKNSC